MCREAARVKSSLVSIFLEAEDITMHRADELDADEPYTPEPQVRSLREFASAPVQQAWLAGSADRTIPIQHQPGCSRLGWLAVLTGPFRSSRCHPTGM